MRHKNLKIVNRDISWLSFNARVLQEATDPTVPLIERIRFVGIFSRNRDEFFRVRVATLQKMLKLGKQSREMIGENPNEIVKEIQAIALEQQTILEQIYRKKIEELKQANIFLVNEKQLNINQKKFVQNYFLEKVMPYLFPIMVNEDTKFPYLRDKSSYLFVRLKKAKSKLAKYSIIELPTHVMSRFLVLPEEKGKKFVMLLDDVIRFGLDDIFYMFDYDEVNSHMIKITRDAEMEIEYDLSKSLVEKISKGLKGRKVGHIVRFTYDENMPKEMMDYICKKMRISKVNNLVAGGRYHNFKDFTDFPDLGKPELLYKKNEPIIHPAFTYERSLFKVVKEKDILLHFPYHSYSHILDFLREASIDEDVISIQLTLYRAAKISSVLNSLLNAIKNGKQVTVVVELQARFDEEANINWATKLQEEGARVIYGVPGLKVHSKLFLITRKEGTKTTGYAHIGTGNFNEQTARIYSDFSLLTANPKITDEVRHLFDFYADNLHNYRYKNLLVAPFFMRKRIVQLINQETINAKAKKPAYICLKMNSLVDSEMIQKLYEASNAGVKIKLIIRGICSLQPGKKSMSQNIEILSIVDKFLEHGRLFIFANGGEEKMYISSADWMIRNFDYRSEAAVPILDEDIKNQLRKIFEIQFADNTKARIIENNQINLYRKNNLKKSRAQVDTYTYLKTLVKAKK